MFIFIWFDAKIWDTGQSKSEGKFTPFCVANDRVSAIQRMKIPKKTSLYL